MSLFGSLFKVAGGFLTGGPAGAIAAGASLLLRKPAAGPPVTAADSIITSTHVTPFSFDRTTKIYTDQGPTNNVPHGVLPGTQITPMAMAAGCPAGYRLNKSTYITRGGGTSRYGPAGTIAIHPKNTTCVKRRRRNVGNAKALRRAISRVKGFVKLARKAHSLVGGHRQRKIGPGRGQNIEIVRG